MNHCDMTLYLVTDRLSYEDEQFLTIIEDACRGGITLLQLREKEVGGREYLRIAQAVKEITTKYKVPLIIDDRLDIAMAVSAEGVHVGQSDVPVAVARKLLGPAKIIGATAKTVPQAITAYEEGASYLGVGAIHETTTKVHTVRTSVDTLDAICAAVPIPVVAIGGLNQINMQVLVSSKIAGIAVVSAIMKSPEPERSTRLLKEMVQSMDGYKEYRK